jgi:hypothetical protein
MARLLAEFTAPIKPDGDDTAGGHWAFATYDKQAGVDSND